MNLEQRLKIIVQDIFDDSTIKTFYDDKSKHWIVWSNVLDREIASSPFSLIEALVSALEVRP